MAALRLVLASASPRRLDLLRQVGLDPEVVAPEVAEHPLPAEPPGECALRLASDKARAVAARLTGRSPSVVVSADTLVVLDGVALGKPADAAGAAEMLRRLSGRSHEVLTGLSLLRTDDSRSRAWLEATRVRFRECSEELIRWYVATGEPLDKAGAYGIQGRGAVLVAGIEGSWTNVVGLPVERLPDLLAGIGIDWSEAVGGGARGGAS